MSISPVSYPIPEPAIGLFSIPAEEPVRVLIADELTLVREGIAALCNAIPGYQVISQVSSGEAAIAEIERLQPNLALLDSGLSDLVACEVVRRICRLRLRTRCVLLSSRRDRKSVLESLRHGACGYLLKSSSAAQMAEALGQLMQGGVYVSPQIEANLLFSEGKRRPADPIESLSSREFQVFSLLVEGVRAKEIAARLSLSPKTVDTYRSSLMRKLDIHDVAGLVKFAIQHDLADSRV